MTIDVEALLASLTLEQKVSLLAGHDNWHTPAVPGVPPMRCSDGPAGVRGTSFNGPPSASFPCSTALGASFDPALVEEVGRALGREARSKHAHVLLAPTVNLHRTPVGGRNFECMSEDPVLTARTAVAYVRGVQSQGVACCIKHFIANDTEHERHTISSDVDEVTLREAYLVPFEAAVRPIEQGGADVKAVMSSYNRINGVHASEHHELLRDVLRGDLGFDGAVISDWFGTHSAANSLEAGLDLEMPGPPRERGDALLRELAEGRTTEARVDESVRRLLRLFEWAGVFDGGDEETTDDSPATREVIRRAAIAGMVLLKNQGDVLPLAADAQVALLGPNSDRGQVQGGGSAQVRVARRVMPLPALQQRGVPLRHEPGCRIEKRLPPMRGSFEGRYRDDDGNVGTALHDRLNFLWMDAPAPGVNRRSFSGHIGGTFIPDTDGDWTIGLTAVGPTVLRIDGEVVVDLSVPQIGGSYFGLGSAEIRVSVPCEAGVARQVEIEMGEAERGQLRGLAVGAVGPANDDALSRAVAAAAEADVCVVVVGTNADWETEGEDRTTLALPGEQDELVRRVAEVNPRTVVVVNAGAPVTMPWLDDVAAVLVVWFPGEEFGDALADVLYGVAEPGGRLPVTFPRRLEDTPAFLHHPGRNDHTEYAEGLLIGHRWYDSQGIAPLFPFGHGLGYTTWELVHASTEGSAAEGVVVHATVRNTGAREGATVVQCYVQPADPSPGRPLRTLQGFAKVHAAAAAEAAVTIELPPRAFSRWDPAAHAFVVTDLDATVMVGLSSTSLRQADASPARGPG